MRSELAPLLPLPLFLYKDSSYGISFCEHRGRHAPPRQETCILNVEKHRAMLFEGFRALVQRIYYNKIYYRAFFCRWFISSSREYVENLNNRFFFVRQKSIGYHIFPPLASNIIITEENSKKMFATAFKLNGSTLA